MRAAAAVVFALTFALAGCSKQNPALVPSGLTPNPNSFAPAFTPEPTAPDPSASGGASATPAGPSAPATASAPAAVRDARLRITSPVQGATAPLPVEVSYSTSGMEISPRNKAALVVEWTDDDRHVLVPLSAPAGTVYADGIPEGTWDLTFRLALANGTPTAGTGSAVLVRSVKVVERGAGGGGQG